MPKKNKKAINGQRGEEFVQKFLIPHGFSKVTDDVGDNPNFQNADLICKRHELIIEVKTLEKEYLPEGGIIPALDLTIVQPVFEDGSAEQPVGYRASFPKDEKQALNQFENPMKRLLQSANRQLKETKAHYYSEPGIGTGVTIFILGEDFKIPLEILSHFVAKKLQHNYSSTDGVMVCSPFVRWRNPVTDQDNPAYQMPVREELSERKKKALKWFYDLFSAHLEIPYMSDEQFQHFLRLMAINQEAHQKKDKKDRL